MKAGSRLSKSNGKRVAENDSWMCPCCGFTGEFEQARPRFLVFGLWHWLVERNRARRAVVCPECGTTLTSAAGRWRPYAVMLLMVLAAVLVAFVVGDLIR